MNKIIYLTRHAQAYHNVAEDWSSESRTPRAVSKDSKRNSATHSRSPLHAARNSSRRRVDSTREGPVGRVAEGYRTDVSASCRLDRFVACEFRFLAWRSRALGMRGPFVVVYRDTESRNDPPQLRRPMQTALIGSVPSQSPFRGRLCAHLSDQTRLPPPLQVRSADRTPERARETDDPLARAARSQRFALRHGFRKSITPGHFL